MLTTGCSAGAGEGAQGDERADRTSQALMARKASAQDAFDDALEELEGALASGDDPDDGDNLALLHDAIAELPTEAPDDIVDPMLTGTTSLRRFPLRRHLLLCHTLKKYMGSHYSHVRFFVGAQVQATAFAQINGGTEQVWDLYNQQFEAFKYRGYGFDMAISTSGGLSAGFTFKNGGDIVNSWRGELSTVTGSAWLPTGIGPLAVGGWIAHSRSGTTLGARASMPAPFVPVNASIQFSWNETGVTGFAFGVSAGVKLKLPVPLPVDLLFTHVNWLPWQGATDLKYRVDSRLRLPVRLEQVDFDGVPTDYLQFVAPTARKAAGAQAKSILAMTGPIGIPASLVALALGSLKDQDLEAEGACADE